MKKPPRNIWGTIKMPLALWILFRNQTMFGSCMKLLKVVVPWATSSCGLLKASALVALVMDEKVKTRINERKKRGNVFFIMSPYNYNYKQFVADGSANYY